MSHLIEREAPLRRRGMPRVRVVCEFYEDQVAALDGLAARADIPRAVLIRHAVAEYLAKHPESRG